RADRGVPAPAGEGAAAGTGRARVDALASADAPLRGLRRPLCGVRGVTRRTVIGCLLLIAAVVAPSLAATGRAGSAPPAVHLVKRGDTLSGIAARYGVSIGSLVASNCLAGPGVRLRIGQRLTIPPPAIVRVRQTVPSPAGRRLAAPPRTLVLAVPDFAQLLPGFS